MMMSVLYSDNELQNNVYRWIRTKKIKKDDVSSKSSYFNKVLKEYTKKLTTSGLKFNNYSILFLAHKFYGLQFNL